MNRLENMLNCTGAAGDFKHLIRESAGVRGIACCGDDFVGDCGVADNILCIACRVIRIIGRGCSVSEIAVLEHVVTIRRFAGFKLYGVGVGCSRSGLWLGNADLYV